MNAADANGMGVQAAPGTRQGGAKVEPERPRPAPVPSKSVAKGSRAGVQSPAVVMTTGVSEAMQRKLNARQAQLSFEKDEGSGKFVARLKDPRTGEVIRQIPPEEMLKIAAVMEKYLGLFVDRNR